MRLLLVTAVLFWAVTACGSARRGEIVDRPVEVSSPQEQLGQEVFYKHCHRCHPGGEGGLGPALNNKPLPRKLIAYQTRRGIGAMPGFDESQISDAELDALVNYVITLRRAD